MTPALGKHIFFDCLADGLLIGLENLYPVHLALRFDHVSVPIEDIGSLARAICEKFSAGSPVEAKLGQLDRSAVSATSYILDAEGRRWSDIVSDVGDLLRADSVIVIYNFTGEVNDIAVVQYNPEFSADAVYPALLRLFRACGKEPDGVVLVRFQSRGFTVLQEAYELFDQRISPNPNDPGWTQRFCARLASVWRYAGDPISSAHILRWISQFDTVGFGNEARHLLMYLLRYGYVTEQRIVAGLHRQYGVIAAGAVADPLPVAFQTPGKSESKLAYYLRPLITLVNAEAAVAQLKAYGGPKPVDLVCFDDCIGSGETVEKYLFDRAYNFQVDDLRNLYASGAARLQVIVYHSDPRGVDRIERNPEACGAVKVHTVCPLDETHRAFSRNSRILSPTPRREAFKSLCQTIGERLNPGSPLGWGDCQWW
jgi:hypothetical protein